jgi:hypothetical protein
MRRLIRWTFLAALTVLVLPILQEFALQHQLYDAPTGYVSTLLEYVQRIGDILNFEYVLVFVGGLSLGTWTDAILSETEGRRSEKYAALGDQTIRVKEAIQMELDNVSRQRNHAPASLLAEVNSAGMLVPFAPKGTDINKWLEMASVYCSHVGPLLRNGHIREARGIAELVQIRLDPA